MSNNNLNVAGHDAPPPPYSETDIYSTTSHSHSQSRSQSHSTPHSPVPPSGPFGHTDDSASRISSNSTSEVIFTPPDTPHTTSNAIPAANSISDIPPSPSAALYFDERPTQIPPPSNDPLVHHLTVRTGSCPDDLPYQAEWAARDVTPQDWATFVNFLIPDHDAARNEAILGEKGATEGSTAGESEKLGREISEDAAQRRREVEATVQQWNDGFFRPRGIVVQLDPADEAPKIPGAWDEAFDTGPSTQREAAPAAAGPSTQRVGGGRSWGPFRIENDGIRYGDSFVADSNGVRIGPFVMDNNGIRRNDGRGDYGSRSFGRGAPWRQGGGGPWGHHHHHGPPPFGGPPGLFDRGRPARHGHGSHSRSSSTSSSASSDSSTSSESIGSLPDYDEVRDSQLPVFIARLQSWTANPQQMRTRADVKQLKADIKAAKNEGLADGMDKRALRAQIKTLAQQWRQLKKQQKKARRERKRERRQRSKAERRERRQQRREMKRAQRDHRRGRNVPPPGPQINIPPINVPPINVPPVHVPPVHVAPVNVPPPPAGPSCSWGGWGRGSTPRASHGGFFGPNGPLGGNGPLGPKGPLGPNGPLGDRGPLGPNGPFGDRGFFGAGGPFGPRGLFGGPAPPPPGPNDPSNNMANPNAPGYTGRFPGSWPEDAGPDVPPPGPASAEKYRTAAGLEVEIRDKTANLASVRDSEKRAAEKEIEALVDKLEHVRLEADEAYARELATRED